MRIALFVALTVLESLVESLVESFLRSAVTPNSQEYSSQAVENHKNQASNTLCVCVCAWRGPWGGAEGSVCP